MLQKVAVGQWSLDAYEGIVPAPILAELREHARALKGARILNVNATSYGGGVSELLRSSVPLLRDLGLTVDWKVIGGDEDFFHATKALHNALQGGPHALSDAEQGGIPQVHRGERGHPRRWLRLHRHPRPPARRSTPGTRKRARPGGCGAATSTPASPTPPPGSSSRPTSRALTPQFTMAEFVPPDLPVSRVETIAPAIDPLSPKNIALDPHMASQILDWIGMEIPGRLVTQISRFDQWKDPLGVINAYRLARRAVMSWLA